MTVGRSVLVVLVVLSLAATTGVGPGASAEPAARDVTVGAPPAGAASARIGASQVSAGEAHGCAVLEDATLKCWGHNDVGQLGLGDTAARGDGAGEMGDALPIVDLGSLPTRVVGTVTESASGPSASAVGDPLGAMLVAAFGGPTGGIIRGTQTDAAGAYRIDVPPETHGVSFMDPAGAHVFERYNDTTNPSG